MPSYHCVSVVGKYVNTYYPCHLPRKIFVWLTCAVKSPPLPHQQEHNSYSEVGQAFTYVGTGLTEAVWKSSDDSILYIVARVH